MKKKYVKNAEGVLVLATAEQLADENIPKVEVEDGTPPPAPAEDPVKELTGIVREMAGDVKITVEQMKAQIAAYQEAARRGFPIFNPETGHQPENPAEVKEFLGHYDLAFQGKELMDKLHHPMHQITEETRVELAKFYALFLRANLFQDWKAREKFWSYYGPRLKTPLGDTGNAFPLPDIVESEILTFAREASVVLQYARIWQMTSDKQSFPSESAAVSVGWGNTTSESEPGVTEVELEANELSAYSVVKNATLMDARSDIVSWLTSALAEAAGLELDNQAFNGSGTPFIGILNASGAGYSVTLTGSSFADLSFSALSEMIAKLDGLKKQGARYWFHGQVLHYVRTLKDDNNRPIFYETVGAPTSGTILGFPYSEVIKCPSTDAANTAFAAFGNLRFLAIGRRLDTATLSVDPYGLWTTNRTRYKLYQRWGMKVGLRNGLVRLLTGS